VILLTSGLTYSGAEIFVMATMQFPNVTRVGEPTAGALSDVLPFTLPNGWEIGLSNERYFASDGVCYEDRGVPPHVEAPMTKAALEKDTDPGLETAMRLIASKRISRN
jgi:C-terminal processing protease CtpA/Prc